MTKRDVTNLARTRKAKSGGFLQRGCLPNLQKAKDPILNVVPCDQIQRAFSLF